MIEKSVLLACEPAAAFALFTEQITEWWPPEHRPSGDRRSRVSLSAAGRFWERAADGREIELGRVREWDPPNRLVLDFYLGTDAARPTLVEVRFLRDQESTRVIVEHRPTPLSQDLWSTGAPRFERSWPVVLQALESHARRPST